MSDEDSDPNRLSPVDGELEDVVMADEPGRFVVARIIADGVYYGEKWFLVVWEDYEFYEADWQPNEVLDGCEEALAEWETQKSLIQKGEAEDELPKWIEAQGQQRQLDFDRHEEHNELRRQQGLPYENLNIPFPHAVVKEKTEMCLDGNAFIQRQASSEDEPDFNRLDNPSSKKKTEETKAKTAPMAPRTPKALAGTLPSRSKQPASTQKAKSINQKTSEPSRSAQPGSYTPAPQREHHLSESRKTAEEAAPPPSAPAKLQAKSGNSAKSKPAPASVNIFAGGITRKKRTPKEDGPQGEGGKTLSLRAQNIMNKRSRDRENNAPPTLPKMRSLNRDDPMPTLTKNHANAATNMSQSNPTEPSTKGAEPTDHVPSTGDQRTPEEVTTRPTPGLSTKGANPADQVPTAGEQRTPEELPTRLTPSPSRHNLLRTGAKASSTEGGTEISKPRKSVTKKKSVRFDDVPTETAQDDEPSLFVQEDTRATTRVQGARFSPPPSTPSIPFATVLNNTPHQPRIEAKVPEPRERKNMIKPCSLGAEASSNVSLVFHGVPQFEAPWVKDLKSHQSLIFSHTCHARDFCGIFQQYEQKASGEVSAPADSDVLETVTERLRLGSLGMFCHADSYCITIFPSKSEDWDALEKNQTTRSGKPLKYIVFGSECFSLAELSDYNVPMPDDSFVGANLKSFLGLEAGQRIFPSAVSKQADKNSVFLAYPPAASQQAKLMSQWISAASKVECTILDSINKPGDWRKFVDHGRGALIIHEDAWRKLRLFPRMFEVLRRSAKGEIVVCLLDRALASSISTTMWTMKNPTFGNMGLRKVAASGVVVLLTQSFILSSPRGCLDCLQWLQNHHNSERLTLRVKLAVPSGVVEWMEELVLDKIERNEWASTQGKMLEACIHILRELYLESATDNELDSSDILAPLVLAPPRIDPSDEQSLVNWFGWWTVHNLEKYCRFYVVGGGPFKPGEEPQVRLGPVKWEKETVNDSDEALRRFHKEQARQRAVADPELQPDPEQGSDQKPLHLVESDHPEALHRRLKALYEDQRRPGGLMLIYFKPVKYRDAAMAQAYRDWGSDTYDKWFRHFNDIKSIKPFSPQKMIMAGLFYTPDPDEIEPWALPPHPWIAMFRPCNMDSLPWEGTELLIWDQRYRGKIKPGHDLYESDLLPEHRDFIAHVGLANDVKNPENTLAKVWLGGWEKLESRYSHPLDITLSRLTMFAANTRRFAPFHESKLPQVGWAMVTADQNRPDPAITDSQPRKIAAPVDEAVLKNDDWDPDARIIFHPPRGRNKKSGDYYIRNRLHQCSTKAAPEAHFTHLYAATSLWYDKQKQHGRGFEHIMVDDWKKVSKELGIPADSERRKSTR